MKNQLLMLIVWFLGITMANGQSVACLYLSPLQVKQYVENDGEFSRAFSIYKEEPEEGGQYGSLVYKSKTSNIMRAFYFTKGKCVKIMDLLDHQECLTILNTIEENTEWVHYKGLRWVSNITSAYLTYERKEDGCKVIVADIKH